MHPQTNLKEPGNYKNREEGQSNESDLPAVAKGDDKRGDQ